MRKGELGDDFGQTPMGHQQVCDRAFRDRRTRSPIICICDEELLAMDISDIRCPIHGLVAFLMPLARGASQ